MHPGQLRGDIIYPTLHHLGLWSAAAEALIIGTIAQESRCGEYIRQVGGGPALGICQMELATHDDIWRNYLCYKPELAHRVRQLIAPWHSAPLPAAAELVTNLAYSVAMCRVHYLRAPDPLPDANDITAIAAYYKQHYNTAHGAATVQQFVAAYRKYILGVGGG